MQRKRPSLFHFFVWTGQHRALFFVLPHRALPHPPSSLPNRALFHFFVLSHRALFPAASHPLPLLHLGRAASPPLPLLRLGRAASREGGTAVGGRVRPKARLHLSIITWREIICGGLWLGDWIDHLRGKMDVPEEIMCLARGPKYDIISYQGNASKKEDENSVSCNADKNIQNQVVKDREDKVLEAKRNKRNRGEDRPTHTLGAKSIARHNHDERENLGDDYTTLGAYLKAHQTKNGEYPDEYTHDMCEKVIATCAERDITNSSDPCILSPILDAVYKGHHGGYERGRGLGWSRVVPWSKLEVVASNESLQHVTLELQNARAEIEAMHMREKEMEARQMEELEAMKGRERYICKKTTKR
ncbi:hypothetical protein Taro_032703 [Colocasia esculenta]|uniref:Uncharacterized protein n=1 Tax=Colocasia esculenta TaxID=4460 RepID=A0A843W2M5_COLES|nr:hypothetical protein [Colocasia esculenta]